MAFPTDPLDVTGELLIDGVWTDVTADVFGGDRDQVTITRGRQSEGSRATPTRCDLSLRNTTGDYSPRNPSGAYYGLIGRNTQARTYIGRPHLGAGGGSGTASTSHVAPTVSATADGLLICGWMSDDPLNYTVPVSMTGGPAETDSTYATMRTAYEAVSAGATGTRTATASTSQGYASVSAVLHGASVAVEETLSGVSSTIDDVTLTTDSGTEAGWWLVAVQGWIRGVDAPMPDAPYGDDGGWLLLGDSTAITGTLGASTTVYLRVRVWARRVNTAGAQVVIFPGIAEADASNAGNHAALYVLSGVDDWDVRATVEVPSWPARSDVSGNDVWVPLQGAGILRRLGQGSSPLRSPLRRALTGSGATVRPGGSLLPVSYWPLEDVAGSTQAASGLAGGQPLAASGDIGWASVSSPGSSALPDWSAETGSLAGPVTGVTAGDDWSIGCLIQYTGSTSWTAVRVTVGGGVYTELRLVVAATLSVTGVTESGSSTILAGGTDLSDGLPHWVDIYSVADGTDVYHYLYADGVEEDFLLEAGVPGAPSWVRVQARSSDQAALGHLGVWTSASTVYTTWLTTVESAITGYAGEVAGRRIERLCHEEGIAVHIVGDADATAAMGVQPAGGLLDLLRECEDADGGILYEPREVLGLAYRTTRARYNLPVTLALTYGAAGEVLPPLEPEDDDRYTTNSVTVTRSGGSSATVEVDSGPLSTADPPDGVGRYDTAVTLNVAGDGRLPALAGWRAHLGTWDEARYPTVRVDLAALGGAGKTALAASAAALDAGDRLTISDLPVWLTPDDVDQQVEGYVETLAQYVRDLRLVCSPAGPWTVGVWESSRYDTAGCELAVSYVAGTDTSVSITTTSGSRWVDGSVSMDWEIGGARVRVTAISGTGTSQTATVQAATVNGVAKSIPAGTAVRLWSPGRYAL